MEDAHWKLKLVEKLPAFDLAWSDALQSRWFDVVAKLLQKGVSNGRETS